MIILDGVLALVYIQYLYLFSWRFLEYFERTLQILGFHEALSSCGDALHVIKCIMIEKTDKQFEGEPEYSVEGERDEVSEEGRERVH